jgi:hypothetical protein
MRHPAAHNARWLLRATTLAGAVGMVLAQSLMPAVALALPAPAVATGNAARHAAPTSAVTVTGPHMYDPKTRKPFPTASKVTVNQSTDLVNQMVQVSWTGFTPSVLNGAPGYTATSTDYPVMVAECAGAAPTSLTPCYGALNGGSDLNLGPYGPYTSVYATTTKLGTGAISIQIQTAVENQGLGCDPEHECSLVIFPLQGGDYLATHPKCTDHSYDQDYGLATAAEDLAEYAGACSWPSRIVVPIHFAPTPDGCPFRNPDFSVIGSPMLLRAVTSWQTGTCTGPRALSISADTETNEPEARTDFLAGLNDIALTTVPASGPGVHPYTYAPVAISATALAYWVDDTKTQQPYTDLKLDPRLLAKLLTTSYTQTYGCTKQPPTSFGCDSAVDHNPATIFNDPEFKQLNPGVNAGGLYQFQTPTVESGGSDMTQVVTSWIAANPDAASFMTGQYDQWGMHVNTNYLGTQYPTNTFLSLDPFKVMSDLYSPVFPASKVATYQVDNWDPGTSWIPTNTIPPTYPAQPVEPPGTRALFAVLDEADAAAFDLPSFAILNHAGKYVTPTTASMLAAVNDMTVNPDGITRSINQASTDPAEYPLTMVVYAMVPTGGISKAKAAKIAQFLDYVAGPGQVTGTSPGQLPVGYVPLTASLRAQTRKAAYEVLHQTGAPKSGHHGTTSTGSSPTSSSSSPSTGKGSSTPTSPGPSDHSKANAAFSSPDSAGFGRLVLPILLIIGALLALAGPSAVVLGRPGARAALVAGWRRVLTLRRLPSLRGRK